MYVLIQTKAGNNHVIKTEPKTETETEPKTEAETEAEVKIDFEAFVEIIDKYVTTILMLPNVNRFNKNIDADLWTSMSQGILSNLNSEKTDTDTNTDTEKLTDLIDNLITLVNTLCTKESYKIKNLWYANELSQGYPKPATI